MKVHENKENPSEWDEISVPGLQEVEVTDKPSEPDRKPNWSPSDTIREIGINIWERLNILRKKKPSKEDKNN